MKDITILAVDLAKSSFQAHGNDHRGRCIFRRSLRREGLKKLLGNLDSCVVAFETCGSSHYWGRLAREAGHEVRLIPAQYVKPFVKNNKNDRHDAEAIAEAAVRPNIHFVAIKSAEQLDIQFLHRIRSRLVRQRTSLVNEMRAIAFEHGITIPLGVVACEKEIAALTLDSESELISSICRTTLADLLNELRVLQKRIKTTEARLLSLTKKNDLCERLQTIPGIGPLSASALVSSVGDPSSFKNGRQFAASLGLVPRHSGTGGAHKNKILGISKRGDSYLRQLLVHGARTVIQHVDKRCDPEAEWIKKLKEAKGWNKTAVALANKNARIVWSLMVNEDMVYTAKKMCS